MNGGRDGHASGAVAISILTSTQQRFLDEFFRDTTPDEAFYLSGGTALAAFYLQHRYSDDLDFFTRSNEALTVGETRASRSAQSARLTVEDVGRGTDFRRLSLDGDTIPEHALRKVELMTDPPPYPAPPRRFGNVLVDDLLCIGVNKTAIIGREEPKDYVDLFLIVHEAGYRTGGPHRTGEAEARRPR